MFNMKMELIPHPILNKKNHAEWAHTYQETETKLSRLISAYLNLFAEAFQSELVFTSAESCKPIVASYGAGPCVIMGAAIQKVGFTAHFSHEGEVSVAWPILMDFLQRTLSKEKKKNTIDLHLRGGIKNNPTSQKIIQNIEQYAAITNSLLKLFYFKICSLKLLNTEDAPSESLSIDTRNGSLSTYDPLVDNPSHYRKLTPEDIELARKSFEENQSIKVVYYN